MAIDTVLLAFVAILSGVVWQMIKPYVEEFIQKPVEVTPKRLMEWGAIALATLIYAVPFTVALFLAYTPPDASVLIVVLVSFSVGYTGYNGSSRALDMMKHYQKSRTSSPDTN